MQTSGHGNEAPMVLLPIGVAIVVGVILSGGPTEALEAGNALVRVIAQQGLQIILGWR